MPSHGSLTKAGKVKSATPKVPAKPRHSPIPRLRNLKNYYKRVVIPAQAQQPPMGETSAPLET